MKESKRERETVRKCACVRKGETEHVCVYMVYVCVCVCVVRVWCVCGACVWCVLKALALPPSTLFDLWASKSSSLLRLRKKTF